MKKIFLLLTLFVAGATYAQDANEITSKNSWLKFGVNAGVPVGDMNDISSFALGLDLRGQYLVTPNFAIGLATGYNHFFAKENIEDLGVIPVAGFVRYYFKPEGLFLGVDAGHGFVTNWDNDGGFYLNPQIGYHNRDWNFYAYYQNTFAQNDLDIQVVGVGVTYNIRF